MLSTHRSVHEPVLGTRLTLRIDADDAADAARAEQAVLDTCDALEAGLSAYRSTSDWSRWRRGELAEATADITALLALSADWHRRSGGAFNPQAGAARARWLAAERAGHPPADAELAALAASIRELPFVVRADGGIDRTGDCTQLDLHALAKGWVVDRAVAAAVAVEGVSAVLVNLGGDLRRSGPGEVQVAIEDPRTPFDNAPPLTRTVLAEGGLATGSGARRPLVVDGRRYSHVLDPRTGQPVQHTLSATAIAPTCTEADALATAAGVLQPQEALALAEGIPDAAVFVLDAAGRTWASERWPGA